MFRRILLGALALLIITTLAGAALLGWTHHAIRQERVALPTLAALGSAALGADRPIRISYINTATQPMPRAAVLDPAKDPHPDAKFQMSHPSFVVEWRDGRILLIDTGMTPAGAEAFGHLIEKVGQGGPIEPHPSVATVLGDRAERVEGIVFTHLHIDHVGGLAELCKDRTREIKVFMTSAQAHRPNYTTHEGLDLVESARCATITVLPDGGVQAVPGFDGVAVVPAAGHTPGSQIPIVRLHEDPRDHLFAFTGDIVNNIHGVTYDVPKPWPYSTFVVPEDSERMAELRAFLKQLGDNRYELMVSHDLIQIAFSSVKPWTAQ